MNKITMTRGDYRHYGTVAKCSDARLRRVSAEASLSDAAQANEEITPQMGVLQPAHYVIGKGDTQ